MVVMSFEGVCNQLSFQPIAQMVQIGPSWSRLGRPVGPPARSDHLAGAKNSATADNSAGVPRFLSERARWLITMMFSLA